MNDPAFVGREGELATLQAQLDRACSGAASIVLIVGAAGVGKSALVSRFLADKEHLSIVRVSGEEDASSVPFALIDQLAAGLGTSKDAIRSEDPSAVTDALTVGAHLVGVLGDLQEEAPVALVVDDAHWADTSSLQALTFALRRLAGDRVLVLACSRDGDAIPEGFARLARERGSMIELGGLDDHEVQDLAAAMGIGTLTLAAAERLREHTAGNPLHLTALIEEIPLDALQATTAPLPAPRSFAVLVASRMAGCEPETESLVQAACVVGHRVEVALAANLAELDDPIDALDEAKRRGLLLAHETDSGLMIAFPHPLVRAAIYDDIPLPRRAELHRTAAALVPERDALAHRVAAATGEDVQLQGELVSAAFQEAARGAWGSAAHFLLLATRVTAPGSVQDRFLLDAVGMLVFAGALHQAQPLLARVGASPLATRRDFVLGQLALRRGRHAEAERLLRDAWTAHDRATDADLTGPIAASIANVCVLLQRGLEAAAWAQRAFAAPILPPALVGFTKTSEAVGYAIAGRFDEAFGSVADLPRDPKQVTWDQIDTLNSRGVLRLWSDDTRRALDDLTEVVERAPSPVYPYRLTALGYRSEAEFRIGLWDEALAHAELCVSLVEDTEQVWLLAFAQSLVGLVLGCRGRWDEAEDRVRAAEAVAAAMGDGASISYAAKAAVRLAHARGDHDGVLRAIESVLALPRTDGAYEPGVHSWRDLYGEALIALGRLDHAERVIVLAEEIARVRGHRSSQANAARARAVLEAARGDAEAARVAFEHGLAVGGEMLGPFERGLLDLAFGRFLRRSGQRREASTHFEAAAKRFEHLGSAPFLESCESELVACGLTPRKRSVRDPARLTPQETAVAKLVAEGLTNRDVAERMVLSVKTIEYHLGNVFAKLGVRSRTALTRRLAQPTG